MTWCTFIGGPADGKRYQVNDKFDIMPVKGPDSVVWYNRQSKTVFVVAK